MHERKPDSLLLRYRLRIGPRLERNGHRQAFRQDRSAVEDDDAILYVPMNCFHAVIFDRSSSKIKTGPEPGNKMRTADPSIRVKVDPCNPGQAFACCGLMELADRLCPEAEGWFAGRECPSRAGKKQGAGRPRPSPCRPAERPPGPSRDLSRQPEVKKLASRRAICYVAEADGPGLDKAAKHSAGIA